MKVFIAYQSESEPAATACKSALVSQRCEEDRVWLWNPTKPWAEPIVEVGKRIINSNIVLIIVGSYGRRSSWVSAEKRLAVRARVPVIRVSEQKASEIRLETLSRAIEVMPIMRKLTWGQFAPAYSGEYVQHVYLELRSFQQRAADRSWGLLPAMRRRLLDYELQVDLAWLHLPSVFNLFNLIFVLIYAFVFPALFYCLAVGKIVALAEAKGLLARLPQENELGTWHEQLGPGPINNHPFFDDQCLAFCARPIQPGVDTLNDAFALQFGDKRSDAFALHQSSRLFVRIAQPPRYRRFKSRYLGRDSLGSEAHVAAYDSIGRRSLRPAPVIGNLPLNSMTPVAAVTRVTA